MQVVKNENAPTETISSHCVSCKENSKDYKSSAMFEFRNEKQINRTYHILAVIIPQFFFVDLKPRPFEVGLQNL